MLTWAVLWIRGSNWIQFQFILFIYLFIVLATMIAVVLNKERYKVQLIVHMMMPNQS